MTRRTRRTMFGPHNGVAHVHVDEAGVAGVAGLKVEAAGSSLGRLGLGVVVMPGPFPSGSGQRALRSS